MDAEPKVAITDDAAPQIDDLEIDDDKGCVETNVIEQGSASTSSESAMPTEPDVAFHSPTKQKILGTPFTTESRFEYPFPNTSSDPSSSSSLILSSSISPLATPIPAPSNYSYPINGLSAASGGITSFSPLISSGFTSTFPTYTLTHPKMRATPPPIPPSLKKRQRWSLTLPLLRRRNSQPNENTEETIVKETRSASIDVMPTNDAQTIIRNS